MEKAFIVAEIGVNHEGNEAAAERLIHLADDSGVDAVKFQTYTAEQYVSTAQPERLERVRGFQLSRDAFRRLAETARSKNVVFFSTPLHENDVDFLDPLVPLFKISSGDLTHLKLIRHTASMKKPLILSTGIGTKEEIANAVKAVIEVYPEAQSRGHLLLMHCVASYPTPDEAANLANIEWLRETFGLPVGYSDHTLGIKAAELAAAMGAVVIEKHFTDRREGRTFHDHALSAEPSEMAELVRAVRRAELLRGKRERTRQPAEEKLIPHLRRSIAAAVDIPAGQPIREEWLTFLRPAWGLPPDHIGQVVGKRLRRFLPAGDLIRVEDLDA